MPQRHVTDVVSLVFGTIFAGFTVIWLIYLSGRLDSNDSWWMGPTVLVVAGAAGLVAALRPNRDEEPAGTEDEAPEPVDDLMR